MARTSSRPLDIKLVDEFVSRLKASLNDTDDFKEVYGSMCDHPTLSAQEIIEVAYRFLGGLKPKSRKAALTSISQERLRLTHAKAKGETAARSKTW